MVLRELLLPLFSPSRFKRDVLWNAGSLVILGICGVIINSVIIFFQGPASLGIFNQVFAFYIVFSQLSVGGLQYSTLKHCSYAQNNLPECARITSSALLLVGCISFSICLCLFGIRNLIGRLLNSPSVALGVALAIPGLFLFSVNKVLIMVLNGLRNMRAFAVFQASRYILILLGVVGVIIFGQTGAYLSLSLTFAESILFVGLMLYIHLGLFHFDFSLSAPFREWFRRHISFGSRAFLSGALMELNTRIDVLMLGIFLSDKMVGIYSFAAIFAEGFAQFNTIIRQNVDPLLGAAFAAGGKEEITKIARKIRTAFFPIMVVMGGVAIACFPLILHFVAPANMGIRSWRVFAILICAIVTASAYRPLFSLLIQGGRPGTFTMVIAGSAIGNLLLNYLLIPLLGIYGAALATASVYLLETSAVILLGQKFFNLRLS